MVLGACHPIRGFIESEFTLAPESPLPVWYHDLPDGYTREDLMIRIRYYAPLFDADDAVFWVESSRLNTLFKATGRIERHPQFYEWAQKDWKARHYPSFIKITINGQTEIIEHKKMEPIFYISNEESLMKVMKSKQ